jgi:DNA-binding transcriptional ArsR family regulator
MKPGDWLAVPAIAKTLHLAPSTVQGHLKILKDSKKVIDNQADGKYRRYQRIADFQIGDTLCESAIDDNL